MPYRGYRAGQVDLFLDAVAYNYHFLKHLGVFLQDNVKSSLVSNRDLLRNITYVGDL
ncbi:MAG: DivIVA domain-containing protein [Tannerella sp.]|nr:DivIVA domain-containing protein [Tannerella sp.]